MKSVFVCAPAIGNYDQNQAMACSMCNLALKQGHFPVMGSAQLPDDELEKMQLSQCDEVWLYYDGQKLRRDMLTDIQRAASADKPVRLIQHEPTAESWPLTTRSWPLAADSYFAADSYADAPDRETELEAESINDPSVEFAAEPVRIAGLLLALKEFETLVGETLPGEWWIRAINPKEDYLLKFGAEKLMNILNALIQAELLPPWPDGWRDEFSIQFGEWDWTEEFPDLDYDHLDTVADSDWHKIGHLLLSRGEYIRAIQFLYHAVTANSQNYLAWSDIGQCCLNLSEFEMARDIFRLALMLAPDHFYAWVGLGRALMTLGEYSEAITAYDEALDIKDGHVDDFVSDLRATAVKCLNQTSN